MNSSSGKSGLYRRQRGALILVTLLILVIITVLGMAAVDSTGLEMRMSSNSRLQQQTFEAAEYTLSWVENNLAQTGYFSTPSVTNDVDGNGGEGSCDTVCFSSACENGYCFNGVYNPASAWDTCTLTPSGVEPYANEALWADGSGMHRMLDIQNTDISAKYFIEFWCYTAKNPTLPITDVGNQARLYRITTFVVGEDGRARVMLRSMVMEN